ncbi:MAG: amidohydrolase, partial [bacterium]
RDGRLLEVGDNERILGKFEADQVIDAGGKYIYPGFNDGHSHFLGYGLNLVTSADLVGTLSFGEVLDRTRAHAEKYPSDWITGRGWDQNDWEVKEYPTKEELDDLFPNTPVVLRRIDGHALLANSEAMRRAGITPKSSVSGGEILLKDGKPTGIFIDNAMQLILAKVPGPTFEQSINALLTAQRNCFASGLTTVTDAGVSKQTIQLMEDLQNSGDLKIRIYAMINPSEENFEYFYPKGPQRNGRLNVSSVKLYVDGALGSRGALLLDPYYDMPGHYGLQIHEEAYYDEMCRRAFDAGFQVNTHAIGDSGNRIMLRTYAKYLRDENDRRWRVEHAQVVDPSDIGYFGQYEIIPSIQSTHCTSDMYWAEDRLGPERISHAYAYRDLLAQNGWIVNGTDFPVEDISPLRTFYAAVARKDLEGWPEGGYHMENAISREDALRSVTIWPAKGSFEESFKGSLEKGKVADFVILEKDIISIPEDEIPVVKVLSTWLDGELVYESK